MATDQTDRGVATDFERAVAEVLDRLGEGDVVTYGEVAAEAGYPGAARAVGGFLRKSSGFCWWRVVAANGRLVPGLESEHGRRLRAEGVEVVDGRVRMR
ncbi:MAG: MGMT family protein [Actinomycetota bacterium]